MSRLKVFGTILSSNQFPPDRQVRAVVAVTSQKAAAKAFGMTLSEFRKFGSENFNPKAVEVACADPGTVYIAQLYSRSEYVKDRRRAGENVGDKP